MKRQPMLSLNIPRKPTPQRPAKVEIAEEAKLPKDAHPDLRLFRAIEFLQAALKDGPQFVDRLVQQAAAMHLFRADLKAARMELNLKSFADPDGSGRQLWEFRN